jgi:hypothetical protein
MIRPRAAIGLLLLSALAVSAYAAPGASALQGTTAFTCEPAKDGAGFSDEHCEKAVGSGATFKHSAIKPGVSTQLSISNNETLSKVSTQKIYTIFMGEEIDLDAGGFASCINKTSLENKENGGKMEAAGEFCGDFFNVVAKKPGGCKVKKGIVKVTEKSTIKTVVEKVVENEKMYVEIAAPAGKPLMTFELEGCGTAGLNNVPIEITGSAKANVTTNTKQLDGPTLEFLTAETENTLKVGANVAKYEGTLTMRMLAEVGKEVNPVTTTTTEK